MTATDAQKLTKRQAKVLAFIVRHWGEHGVYPTIREIQEGFGFASPNGVTCHLQAIADKGLIEWERDTKSRGVRVKELTDGAAAVARVYLGKLSRSLA